MATASIRRAGFTLIELLVVIALIATLAALSAGAFTQVRKTQMKKATDATLNKLHSALDNRWKAIGESVKRDQTNNTLPFRQAMRDSGDNPEIAKSLLMYAKVKNELPMTFAEARGTAVASPPDNLPAGNYTVVGSIHIPARANFLVLPAATATPTAEESGACFYVAIRSSGGGGAMTDGDGLEQQSVEFTGAGWTTSARVFKDSYGTPIAFVRQAYPPEVNSKPYIAAAPTDPFDPGAKATALINARWGQIIANIGAPGFSNMPTAYQGARNFVPTLVSAGPDRKFDSSGDLFAGTNNDNQISYRVRREGGSGD